MQPGNCHGKQTSSALLLQQHFSGGTRVQLATGIVLLQRTGWQRTGARAAGPAGRLTRLPGFC